MQEHDAAVHQRKMMIRRRNIHAPSLDRIAMHGVGHRYATRSLENLGEGAALTSYMQHDEDGSSKLLREPRNQVAERFDSARRCANNDEFPMWQAAPTFQGRLPSMHMAC
jgi:hypothetical protein